MKKIILICLMAFIAGFLDAFLKDKNIDVTPMLFTMVGYWSCYILNDF